jgi:hypothetical protein
LFPVGVVERINSPSNIIPQGHSHFFMPWSYIVALKDYKSRADWYRTGPELQLAIQHRLRRSKSGKSSLRYFDAATMVGYQIPSKAQEFTCCRGEESRSKCDKSVGVNLDLDYLKVDKSTAGERAGRGLFALRDIPYHATIGLGSATKSFLVPPSTWSVLESIYEIPDGVSSVKDEISTVYTFIEGVYSFSFHIQKISLRLSNSYHIRPLTLGYGTSTILLVSRNSADCGASVQILYKYLNKSSTSPG